MLMMLAKCNLYILGEKTRLQVKSKTKWFLKIEYNNLLVKMQNVYPWNNLNLQ